MIDLMTLSCNDRIHRLEQLGDIWISGVRTLLILQHLLYEHDSSDHTNGKNISCELECVVSILNMIKRKVGNIYSHKLK